MYIIFVYCKQGFANRFHKKKHIFLRKCCRIIIGFDEKTISQFYNLENYIGGQTLTLGVGKKDKWLSSSSFSLQVIEFL